MLELIQKPLRRLKQRYEKSGFAQFLSWWRAELLSALPPAWREWLAAEPPVVTLAPAADGWQLRRVRAGRVEVEETVSADRDALVGGAERLRAGQEHAPRQVLMLPSAGTLRRRLTLPLAAEEHLASVLAFEMDRQTPFRADQIYFDHRIQKRDPTARTMLVELLAVPRAVLDELLQKVGNLPLDAADVAVADLPAGFNLLPPERRARRVDKRLRVNLILGAAAVALIWLVMWQSLALREQAIEHLNADKAQSSAAAMQSAELKRQLRDAIEGASFLADKKAGQAVTVDVLAEITRLVPDDTWLERLSFIGNQVQLQGQSARADKLIGILTDSRCLSKPQFQGIIQPDGATGKERFSLAADLKTGACHGTDTAAGSR
ncbi:MAG: PilN domain-containing protein [Lysobacterales bacterium]